MSPFAESYTLYLQWSKCSPNSQELRFSSSLDANSGFWQVPLSEQSARLTTFITPFGRVWFNRMPFGTSSAPEHFQRCMSSILAGAGVVCLDDDVLIHARTQEEHDKRLAVALQRIQAAGLTLNKGKCSPNERSTSWVRLSILREYAQIPTKFRRFKTYQTQQGYSRYDQSVGKIPSQSGRPNETRT